MKNITLYVDNGTYLTKLHPYTKLIYILTAICAPLLIGQIWGFCAFILCNILILISTKLLKRAVPLIIFSFTILLTIFIIHGLFNYRNETVLWQIGPVCFYKEGVLYATRIGLNIFKYASVFCYICIVHQAGGSGGGAGKVRVLQTFWIYHQFCISDHSTDDRHDEYDHGCPEKQRDGNRRKSVSACKSIYSINITRYYQFTDQHQGEGNCPGSARIRCQL